MRREDEGGRPQNAERQLYSKHHPTAHSLHAAVVTAAAMTARPSISDSVAEMEGDGGAGEGRRAHCCFYVLKHPPRIHQAFIALAAITKQKRVFPPLARRVTLKPPNEAGN